MYLWTTGNPSKYCWRGIFNFFIFPVFEFLDIFSSNKANLDNFCSKNFFHHFCQNFALNDPLYLSNIKKKHQQNDFLKEVHNESLIIKTKLVLFYARHCQRSPCDGKSSIIANILAPIKASKTSSKSHYLPSQVNLKCFQAR